MTFRAALAPLPAAGAPVRALTVLLPVLAAACATAERVSVAARSSAALAPADASRVYSAEEVEQKPRVLDREEVARVLEANYPRSLRNEPSRRTTQLLALIDETGGPRETEVVASSGLAALDAAAVRVIEAMRFDPPMRQGMRVRSATLLPITFNPAR